MKMTHFRHILLKLLEFLGTVAVNVLGILLISLCIAAIVDIIKG